MSKYKYVFGHITETNLIYELLAIKSYSDTILKFREYNYDINNYNKTVEQMIELNKCIRSEIKSKLAAANTHFVNVIDKIKDYFSEFIDYQMDGRNIVSNSIKQDLIDYVSDRLSWVSIDQDVTHILLMGTMREIKNFICSSLSEV